MANNRLYIEDTETGETFLLAKGWGQEWQLVQGLDDEAHDWDNAADRLAHWLNSGERDLAAKGKGPTKLRLVTEDTIYAEKKQAG